jgi:hypothetical protein
MKVYLLISAIIFILFALVQVNDNDSVLVWVSLYAAAAWIGAANAWKPQNREVVFVLFLMFFIGAVQLFPANIGGWLHNEERAKGLEMDLPFIEEARESMGLLLAALHALAVWVWLKRRSAAMNKG